MAWFLAPIYDTIMAGTERSCLGWWRRDLLAGASGDTLEIGAGTGIKLQYYSDAVDRLVLLEPDPLMRSQLVGKAESRDNVEFCDLESEALPFPDDSFDTVVSTLVLCTVPDPGQALREIRRVLRTDGQFLFLEHVVDQESVGGARWQRWVEPLWKRCAGGCHLTRDTERAITEAGFELSEIKRERMRKALPLIAPSIRGVAVLPT